MSNRGTADVGRYMGEFAHELRNFFSSAQMLLNIVLRPTASSQTSTFGTNSQILAEVLPICRASLDEPQQRILHEAFTTLQSNEKKLFELMTRMSHGVRRCIALTSDVSSLVRLLSHRPDEDAPQAVNIADVARHCVSELGEDFALGNMRLTTELPTSLVITGLDWHFELVCKHLLLNAKDAILEKRRNGQESEPERDAVILAIRNSGDGCTIMVQDSGIGMSSDLQAQILTPYFTTKPGGTGLGLSIVEQVAALYGGGLQCTSNPETGSVFSVRLRNCIHAA